MHFPDLLKRTFTASMLIMLTGLWLFTSFFYPGVWLAGIMVVAGISLYEWFCMSKNSTGGLKYYGFIAIILGFLGWIFLHVLFGIDATIIILVTAMSSDMLAYFGGRIIQGPKLCPRISPSKTYAGAISSLVLGPPCAMVLLNITIEYPSYSWFWWCVTTALCIVGQIGDLLESGAKRSFGVKDSGNWLPGHGGLLDRLDSVLAMSVALAVFFWTFGA